MCGRFNNHYNPMRGWAELLAEFPDVEHSYNIGPSRQIAAFRSTSGDPMRWGLIPGWSKTFDSSYATFNARIESLAEKPAFRNAWQRNQRCLIPMAGYYEWQGPKGEKQPYYISDFDTGGLVAAGLYEQWGEQNQLSCTMITQPAITRMDSIHHRMPVLLKPDDARRWLNSEAIGNHQGQDFLLSTEPPKLGWHPVSKAVGNVRNDEPRLIQPIS